MTSATARSAMPGHRCTTCRSAPSEQARIASRPSQCCAEKDIYMQAIVLSMMYCCRVPEQFQASSCWYGHLHQAQTGDYGVCIAHFGLVYRG